MSGDPPSTGAPGPRAALASLVHVRVGSTNAPKIEAVRAALARLVGPEAAPVLRVEGVDVASGVAEQPVGFAEIARGARNRARAAAASGDCDIACGIEDGLVEIDGVGPEASSGPEIFNVGCAVVTDGTRESLGLSSGFAYPPGCAAPALTQRAAIGDLFDDLWRRYTGEEIRTAESAEPGCVPSGRGIGNIGKLTLGALPRSEYASHAVVCALIRFLHPTLYFGTGPGGVP